MIKNAAIDIGSNTLKIAYLKNNKLKNYEKVLNLALFVQNNCLNADGIKVLINEFTYLSTIFDLKNAFALSTAVFRRINNAKEILELLYKKFNLKVQILTQEEEAALTRLANKNLGYDDFYLVDIGGNSCEITSNDEKIYFDFGLLSIYEEYKKSKANLRDFVQEFLNKKINNFKLKEGLKIVLTSKSAIFAKSLKENKYYKDVDDTLYHKQLINKDEIINLSNFLETSNEEQIEFIIGKNRKFAVLIACYLLNFLFKEDTFIISSFSIKEALLIKHNILK
ncbi:Ppx/GppA phosphatase family protein [Campylobacter canadensis]|uniref:Ppx/GppA phosphatase N-terminal domain-containing protein n=1 Tax=Campylobacter canadensis TaxID=449520 RepID=A0ABS7WRS7_9BACT|nr:hypothetical protein [Campylobacter canadensis]MBZ7987042.1 hypothetical protein [Campylobacter canadensis]MBZ7994656.1 hypothetical protein [Campylobacter canadensis]MBZ7996152.1 hypothetical protein [Campylobacter canadensis]MBZ7998078.1 hypothetical protein [Campylobacter canadensis]MBZ8000032.1 hypothetical protein [Campylobacter canadensis]